MVIAAFQVHLRAKVQLRQAALGCFDGQHISLAAATPSGRVLFHTPNLQLPAATSCTHLSAHKHVTAMAAGCLGSSSCTTPGGKGLLFLGAPGSVQALDTRENRDAFFAEMGDGARCLLVGRVGAADAPTVLVVGGGSSVVALDASGREVMWAPTSDAVTALALVDLSGDGHNTLIVACADASLRFLRDGQAVSELREADAVVALAALGGSRFAYGLVNGTVGVYDGAVRLWRVKSKHELAALAAYDLDADGVLELVSGWANGRVEVRCQVGGQLVARDALGAGVAALLVGDLRGRQQPELVALSLEGEVRGYLPQSLEVHTKGGGGVAAQQAALVELSQRRQALLAELASYQANTQASGSAPATHTSPGGAGVVAGALGGLAAAAATGLASAARLRRGGSGGGGGGGGGGALRVGELTGVIPPDTRVASRLVVDRAAGCVILELNTNNDSVIKAAVVFGEQIFEGGESLLWVPPAAAPRASVPLRPRCDTSVPLMVKVLVGARASAAYHVFEVDMELPKYALYAADTASASPAPGDDPSSTAGLRGGAPAAMAPSSDRSSAGGGEEPAGRVVFVVPAPASRLAAWVEERFNARASSVSAERWTASFVSLRDGQPLRLQAAPAPGGVQVTLGCGSLALAGELVQDLAVWLRLEALDARADFPQTFAELEALAQQIEGADATRVALAASGATKVAALKRALVRAEDARLLQRMPDMLRHYTRVMAHSRELMVEHAQRVATHEALLAALKGVNQAIQAASRLRVGPPKARTVAAARAAVKAGNLRALVRVLREGGAPVPATS